MAIYLTMQINLATWSNNMTLDHACYFSKHSIVSQYQIFIVSNVKQILQNIPVCLCIILLCNTSAFNISYKECLTNKTSAFSIHLVIPTHCIFPNRNVRRPLQWPLFKKNHCTTHQWFWLANYYFTVNKSVWLFRKYKHCLIVLFYKKGLVEIF